MKNGKEIDQDGNIRWYLNGKYHREDGPAIERSNGDKEWWFQGKRHREDGPVFEGADGSREWWLNDEPLEEDEFNQWLMKKSLNEKLQSNLAPKSVVKRSKI